MPEQSTALITNDAVVLGLLAATLGLVFWTASRGSGFWKRFYSYVPALLICYLLPSVYNTIGLIDGEVSSLYPVARDYLLPSSLVLLCIAIDLGAVLRLGPKAVIMFLTGTAGVMLGAVVAFSLMGVIAPGVVAGETWRGMTTIAGSWIGGGIGHLAGDADLFGNAHAVPRTVARPALAPVGASVAAAPAPCRGADLPRRFPAYRHSGGVHGRPVGRRRPDAASNGGCAEQQRAARTIGRVTGDIEPTVPSGERQT